MPPILEGLLNQAAIDPDVEISRISRQCALANSLEFKIYSYFQWHIIQIT